VGARKRVTPATSSTLQPTDYPDDPPDFDRSRFKEIAPDPPPAPEDF